MVTSACRNLNPDDYLLAYEFTRLAKKHLGVRKDIVSVPLLHDTPGQIAQPGGHALTRTTLCQHLTVTTARKSSQTGRSTHQPRSERLRTRRR